MTGPLPAGVAADPDAWASASAAALAGALHDGDIDAIVTILSEAETVRSGARAHGQAIALAAAEVARRAERTAAQAIRAGQRAGQIRQPGQRPASRRGYTRVRGNGLFEDVEPDGHGRRPAPPAEELPGPGRWLTRQQRSGNAAGAYQLADGVTDAQFETALAAAKAEHSLTRANLIRHLSRALRRAAA